MRWWSSSSSSSSSWAWFLGEEFSRVLVDTHKRQPDTESSWIVVSCITLDIQDDGVNGLVHAHHILDAFYPTLGHLANVHQSTVPMTTVLPKFYKGTVPLHPYHTPPNHHTTLQHVVILVVVVVVVIAMLVVIIIIMMMIFVISFVVSIMVGIIVVFSTIPRITIGTILLVATILVSVPVVRIAGRGGSILSFSSICVYFTAKFIPPFHLIRSQTRRRRLRRRQHGRWTTVWEKNVLDGRSGSRTDYSHHSTVAHNLLRPFLHHRSATPPRRLSCRCESDSIAFLFGCHESDRKYIK